MIASERAPAGAADVWAIHCTAGLSSSRSSRPPLPGAISATTARYSTSGPAGLGTSRPRRAYHSRGWLSNQRTSSQSTQSKGSRTVGRPHKTGLFIEVPGSPFCLACPQRCRPLFSRYHLVMARSPCRFSPWAPFRGGAGNPSPGRSRRPLAAALSSPDSARTCGSVREGAASRPPLGEEAAGASQCAQ